ncbi:ABC transporter permease subunit [Paenibacillus sp. HB172176]|uniref:ABC transporter permease n=1 Tax=Paenibacillus sp. HB172176 TaxID=2493690 RepID=UPI00143ABE23|nr:ABC transporter permease subunit [Paenibacillus sp. HB172176]
MTGSLLFRRFSQHWPIYLLAVPGVVYFLVFHYAPMWGLILSFQNYSPFKGFWDSDWVGFDNYAKFFSNDNFFLLLKNTLLLSFYNMFVFFPLTIILAIMLSELRLKLFVRFTQTVVYMPHFLSWVVIYGMTISFFGATGVFNHALEGWFGDTIYFMTSNDWFRPLVTFQAVWKDAGWGTIIFLAALAGINPELYEAAKVDGASRFQNIWHVTLPALKSTIVILLLLRLGNSLDANFQQVFLMYNNLNHDASSVFDLYVYQVGIQKLNYSFAITVGVFKSLASLILVLFANYAAKWLGEEGIF